MQRRDLTDRASRYRLLAILLVSALASLPALLGSWVYDDWVTATHEAQQHWHDLAQVFARDSSAYMVNRASLAPFGVTYRPLSMASLIAVQAVAPDSPLLHHALSLLLHLACVTALYAACLRVAPHAGRHFALLLAAIFALHPVNLEAYGWINGRSDVLAGAFAAALAVSLFGPAPQARRGPVLAALCAAGAVFSKEPAVVAVGTLALSAVLAPRGVRLVRARLADALGALAGAVAALVVRAWVTRHAASGAALLLADREVLGAYAGVLRLALEHLLLPLPRAMLCLSYELESGPRPLDFLVLIGAAAGVTWLIARRELRAAFLFGGALFSLLPVLPVRNLVWLGFDRYLYMPAILALLGLASVFEARRAESLACTSNLACTSRLGRLAQATLLALLAGASFVTAQAYRDQGAWLTALIHRRPDDPSGYIKAAEWYLGRGDRERAQQAALSAPRRGHSPALSHELAVLLLRFERAPEAFELIDATLSRHPRSSLAAFDALMADVLRGRFNALPALLPRLTGDPVLCPAARAWLQTFLEQADLPVDARKRCAPVLDELRCRGPTS